MKFSKYLKEDQTKEKVMMLLYVLENEDKLNEDKLNEDTKELQEGFTDFMKSLGISKRTSAIDYFVGFATTAGKIVLAGINGDEEKIKSLLPKITKEQFLDFLISLDKITLGIITGPLELVSVITGWNLEDALVSLVKGTKRVVQNIHGTIETLKTEILSIFAPHKAQRLNTKLNYISKSIPKSIPK